MFPIHDFVWFPFNESLFVVKIRNQHDHLLICGGTFEMGRRTTPYPLLRLQTILKVWDIPLVLGSAGTCTRNVFPESGSSTLAHFDNLSYSELNRILLFNVYEHSPNYFPSYGCSYVLHIYLNSNLIFLKVRMMGTFFKIKTNLMSPGHLWDASVHSDLAC